MATNVERLAAALAALYDGAVNAAKTKKITDAVIDNLDQASIEVAFPGATLATLTAEQKAFFVVESMKGSVRNRLREAVQRQSMQAVQAARQAARQAEQDATQGF